LIRDELIELMLNRNIQCAIYYPVPVHLQPSYRNCIGTQHTLRHSEKELGTILSLPMFPELTDKDIDKIIMAIKESFIEGRK